MAVVNGPITITGSAGVKPMIKYMLSTDSMSVVTAAGYLNENLTNLGGITENDMLLIRYSYVPETNAGTNAFFNVAIASNGIITLSEDVSEGNVVLPVVDNDFANFSGTAGKIKDSGYSPSDATKAKVVMASAAVLGNHIAVFSDTAGTLNDDAATAINGGNIQAGLSGTAGTLASFPGTAAKGSFKIVAVDNAGDTLVTLSNATHGQASVYSIPDVGAATGQVNVVTGALVSGNIMAASGTAGKLADGGLAANKVLTASFATPDVNANLVTFDAVVTSLALASGGITVLFVGGGAKRFKVRELYINGFGTNFSGGGGDRNMTVGDGVNDYSIVPAATMQALANGAWGSTGLPFPASVALNTSSVAGNSFVARYEGGTTDYSNGEVHISGILERVV